MQPRISRCPNLGRYVTTAVAAIAGFGSAIPNISYAVATALKISPTDVSFAVAFKNASAAFATLGTGLVSGFFGMRYSKLAAYTIVDEIHQSKKHPIRFITESIMAFNAALAGGTISGDPYSGVIQWGARALGFTVVGSLSFMGMCNYIKKLTDKDLAFKLLIINTYLKHINPKYKVMINTWLQGRELNEETLHDFLERLFNLAEYLKNNKALGFPPLFNERSTSERAQAAADNVASFVLTAICSIIYAESAFDGVNILFNLFNRNLDHLPDYGKWGIGYFVGLPLILFVFLTVEFFNSPLVKRFPEIRKKPGELIKSLFLIAFCLANAEWYEGLANLIRTNKNIFSGLLDTEFGSVVFPWAAFITCFVMGVNGLAPEILSQNINWASPTLDDLIKCLEGDLIHLDVERMRQHVFFKPQARQEEKVVPRTDDVKTMDAQVDIELGLSSRL